MSEDARIETAFARLLNRQPTDKEIESLYRAKNALGLHDNDALWLILMALEAYDTQFRRYPQLLSDHALRVMDAQRATMSDTAKLEMQKALAALSDAVSHSAESIARRTAGIAQLHAVVWAFVATIVLSTLSLLVGFVLGSGRLPYWANQDPSAPLVVRLICVAARTPVGYVVSCVAILCAIFAVWRASLLRTPTRIYLIVGALALLFVSAVLLSTVLS